MITISGCRSSIRFFIATLILWIISSDLSFSQDAKLDSLVKVLNAATIDSVRSKVLDEITFVYIDAKDFENATKYADMAMPVAERINRPRTIARVYYSYAKIAFKKGEFDGSIEFDDKAIKLIENLPPTKLTGMLYGNQGNSYYRKGLYPQSLEYFLKALNVFEKTGDKKSYAGYSGNIGSIYQSLKENEKAIDFFNKALKMNEELKSEQGMAINLVCLGNVCSTQKKNKEALDYFFKALKINEKIGDKEYVANNLGNISVAYQNLKEYDKAYETQKKAELLLANSEDLNLIITSNLNLGHTCMWLKKYAEAESYLLKNVELLKTNQSLYLMNDNSKRLSELYHFTGNYEKSAYYLREHIGFKDSILNDEDNKKVLQQQIQFDFDRKAVADSIKSTEEKKTLGIQLEQEKTQRYSLYGGVCLLLVFAGFMQNRFKVTQKQKKLIEIKEQEAKFQKELVEEKQKEILDSINYAKRIQYSLLASDRLLSENLKEHFLFFKPKDIVSGDFYWGAELSNDTFALITADSTGHGVPGAIMSMLNISCLNEVVNSDKQLQPAEILNSTRKKIIRHLSNDGSAEGGKDGMDCSLVIFDIKNKKLSYAAANNPVWIIRGKELIALKADRMPIGKHIHDQAPFVQHEFKLLSNDMVYTLTDGFADQFGGPSGKKFKYKQLGELLVSIHAETPARQREILDAKFEEWKGSLEQIDDVTIIGVRIS